MAEMGTQTVLRDMLFDDESDVDIERGDNEDAELDSDFAHNLIGGVIDNMSESSAFKEKKVLDADRLQEIPDFELEDILGEFDVDENGNFIIRTEDGHMIDNNGKRVNAKGYFIDQHRNVINKNGQIIFYANEMNDDGEIPAPFVYEKYKNDFLTKALQRKEATTLDPDYMVDDDEDLVEAELKKLRPSSRESSVDSLVAENPGLYVEGNLSIGRKSAKLSPDGELEANQVNKPNGKSPSRYSATEKDKELARSYGGKAKGGLKKNIYKGQPQRINREQTREMFPSLAVESQVQQKFSKIVDNMSIKENEHEDPSAKFERNQELRRQLEKLKEEHFKDFDTENLGDLNMDLIEQKIDDFDQVRQKEYEERMRRHYESNMNSYVKPPTHTSSYFYQNRMPFQSSDLLPNGQNSRLASSKQNSRLENRSKIKPASGLQKIYGNLGELVVPAEYREQEQVSRMYSPGSTMTLRSGMSRQATRSKFESNSRIKGLEMIYMQKLENRGKATKKPSQGKRKAKFRTLHNKFIDDPSILIHDDITDENLDDNLSRFEIK